MGNSINTLKILSRKNRTGLSLSTQTAWSPEQEASLVAWYQYQTGITLNGFTPEVSGWDNSVPITNPNFGLYHLTQTAVSPQTRPDYINGVISFNGTGDCLNVTGQIQLTGDFTIGFKVKNTATNVTIYGSNSVHGEFLRFSNNINIKIIIDNAITLDFPISNQVNLLAYYTISRSNNNYYLTQNGGGLISPNIPAPIPITSLVINIDAIGVRKTNTNFYKGEMSEIQIYNSSSQTLINNVNTRLASL